VFMSVVLLFPDGAVGTLRRAAARAARARLVARMTAAVAGAPPSRDLAG
jgi:hypothetical protein